MTGRIYPLRNHIVFSAVFGKEGNEPLLARLIEATLGLEDERGIKELTLLNPFNLQNWKDAKFSIVDVRAKDHRGRQFTIEMQVQEQQHFAKRMSYYLALLYTGQLKRGEEYELLNPAFGIAILDYIMFDGHDRLQSSYGFLDTVSGEVLPDLMELHFIELPKYRDRPRALRTKLEKWLYLLRFGEMFVAGAQVPEDLAAEKELAMAINELRRINADDRLRARIEQRDKAERDLISREKSLKKALEAARAKIVAEGKAQGIAEGKAEGIAEGSELMLRKNVRAMLAKGLTPEFISEVTERSVEEILKIQAESN